MKYVSKLTIVLSAVMILGSSMAYAKLLTGFIGTCSPTPVIPQSPYANKDVANLKFYEASFSCNEKGCYVTCRYKGENWKLEYQIVDGSNAQYSQNDLSDYQPKKEILGINPAEVNEGVFVELFDSWRGFANGQLQSEHDSDKIAQDFAQYKQDFVTYQNAEKKECNAEEYKLSQIKMQFGVCARDKACEQDIMNKIDQAQGELDQCMKNIPSAPHFGLYCSSDKVEDCAF